MVHQHPPVLGQQPTEPGPRSPAHDVHVPVEEARPGLLHQRQGHPRPHQAQGVREVRDREVCEPFLPHSPRPRPPAGARRASGLEELGRLDHRRADADVCPRSRQALRYIIRNTTLPPRVRAEAQLQLTQMHCYTNPTQIRNRCILGGKGRGIFRDFKMSRVGSVQENLAGETRCGLRCSGRGNANGALAVQFQVAGHRWVSARCAEGELVEGGAGGPGKICGWAAGRGQPRGHALSFRGPPASNEFGWMLGAQLQSDSIVDIR